MNLARDKIVPQRVNQHRVTNFTQLLQRPQAKDLIIMLNKNIKRATAIVDRNQRRGDKRGTTPVREKKDSPALRKDAFLTSSGRRVLTMCKTTVYKV